MTQLDRIEAMLYANIQLMAVIPSYINAVASKDPEKYWKAAADKHKEIIENLRPIYENTDDITSEPREVS